MQVNTVDFERYAHNAEAQRHELGQVRDYVDRWLTAPLKPSGLPGSVGLASTSGKARESLDRYLVGAEEGAHFIALFAREVARLFPEGEHINAKMISEALADVPRAPA